MARQDRDWTIPAEWFVGDLEPEPEPPKLDRLITDAEARSLWLVGWPALLAATAAIIYLIRKH